MIKHRKYRLFKGFTRAISAFPGIVRTCYDLWQFLVVRMPFLRPSFKWKAIRKRSLHFEINRTLYRKGKPCEPSILNGLAFEPADGSGAREDRARPAGTFVLDVAYNGLSVLGEVKSGSAHSATALLDDAILRTMTLDCNREFAFKVSRSALLSFPPESILELRTDSGEFLSFQGSAAARLLVHSGRGGIREALEAGNLVTKRGGLGSSEESTRARQGKFLALYAEVREAFDRIIGHPLFLTYGTLLGCVRSGDFIPNDDDFDAGYVSNEMTPEAVKKETIGIMLTLIREGFNIGVNSVGRLFKINRDTGVHLDLMPVWFEGGWNVAYRGAGVAAAPEDFLPVAEGSMRDRPVYLPAKPEVFLEGYYGADWRVPDPGYVSIIGRRGKDLRKNYARFLITPLEYLTLERKVEAERRERPGMGRLSSASLRGEL